MKTKMIVATRHGLRRFERINDYWEERDHALTGLEITALAMRGKLGVVGTTKGVYLSQDSGASWELDSKGIQTPHVRWVDIHPQDNRKCFVGTKPANIYSRQVESDPWRCSQQVARLRDEKDWYMPYSPNPGCVRGFAFSIQRIYAAVEVGGLLVSEDDGDTWSLAPGSSGNPRKDPEKGQIHPDVHSVASPTSSEDLVFAPTGGGLYLSKDGGKRWSLKYAAYCRAVWVNPVDTAQVILGPADGVGRGGRIEHTADGGETWQLCMDNIADRWPDAMVERFVAAEGEIFAILSNGKLLTARIGELSWQSLLPGIGNVVALALF